MPFHRNLPLRQRALSIQTAPLSLQIWGTPEPDIIDIEDNDDAVSVVSNTSTIEYQQERFATFGERILTLAQDIWSGTCEYDFAIMRMTGGYYTRTLGISRLDSNGNIDSRYVLRTPRVDEDSIECYLGAQNYVKNIGNIPVPDVVAFDATTENVLRRPYMVQNRLPGMNLANVYPALNHPQQCLVATRLGEIYRQMLSRKEPVAGRPCLPSNAATEASAHSGPTTRPFFKKQSDFLPSEHWVRLPAFELIRSTFQACKASNPETWVDSRYMDKFIRMTESLKANGWFNKVGVSLCHLDLHPRNIFVDPKCRDLDQILTGIISWDDAIFGPSFMACAPPQWIWAWLHNEEEDERTANDTPSTPEGRELKSLFEKAAGPEYLRFAYAPAYRLARRLVRFALETITSEKDMDEADAMVREWEETVARGESLKG